MRHALAVLALSALATGCTVSTGGSGVPAATLGHAPEPLPMSALHGLLLDGDDLDTIMGASGLAVVHASDKMYTNHSPDDDCLADWVNVDEKVYAGTGWTAVQREELQDGDQYSALVFQSVVSFPDALGAHDAYADQVTLWAQCDNRRINERDLDDPEDSDHYWSLDATRENDGMLTLARVAEGSRGWSCQRALTAANNIVVDVDACARDITDEGVEIAKQIAQNVSDKQ